MVCCVHLSLIFSQAYIVAKATFLLKRWIQMMLNKGSSQNSLQGQWIFEPLPAPPYLRTSEESTLPKMNDQYFIFPPFFPVISVLWAWRFEWQRYKDEAKTKNAQPNYQRMRVKKETRQTQERAPKLPSRTLKGLNLSRSWPPLVISWVFFAPFSTRDVLEGYLRPTWSHFKGSLVGLNEVNSNPS